MMVRKSNTIFILGIIVWLLLVPLSNGYCQTEVVTITEDYSSPQNYAFELRFGLYRPEVDDEFGGEKTPYRDIFGTDSNLLFGVELDWQITSIYIGSLGIGGFIGYFRDEGKALLPGNTNSAQEEVTFNILPLELILIIRIDILADKVKIPIVPYFKSGLCYYIWWSEAGDSLSKNDKGEDALGGIWGYKLGTGIMLRLDQFDLKTAKDFDREWGVNHTSLFFEWFWTKVNNFEQGGLNLSDSSWSVGIALEF